MKTKADPNILILGAGFAGLAASKELGAFGKVTVIDPSPSFEFFPNIHELVSGFKSPADLRLDIRKILKAREQEFVQEKAVALDQENRTVTTSSGTQYPYDYLIIAMGGVNNERGVPGVAAHAFPFKSVDQCHAIGQKLASLEKQRSPYTVTIVGGGVEGIEALGEILRAYSSSTHLSIHLIEGGNQLLPGMPSQVHRHILKICKHFPVSFHFGKKVSQVEADKLTLSDGENLFSELVIWTGGVKSHPQLEAWGLAAPNIPPQVNSFLQSQYDPNILIIGDAIDVTGGGEKQAYLALEMGQVAGHNARSILTGAKLKTYQPQNLPSIYSFGNLNCFIIYKGLVLSGLPFASLKETIYQVNMASIQGLCERPETFIDTFERAVNGTIGSLNSVLTSPVSLLRRFRIKFSYQ